jgi:hypothetical protein
MLCNFESFGRLPTLEKICSKILKIKKLDIRHNSRDLQIQWLRKVVQYQLEPMEMTICIDNASLSIIKKGENLLLFIIRQGLGFF